MSMCQLTSAGRAHRPVEPPRPRRPVELLRPATPGLAADRASAQQRVVHKLHAALSASYDPVLLAWRGLSRVITRAPTRIEVWDVLLGAQVHAPCLRRRAAFDPFRHTPGDVERAQRLDLAKRAWDGKERAPEILEGDPAALASFAEWAKIARPPNPAGPQQPEL